MSEAIVMTFQPEAAHAANDRTAFIAAARQCEASGDPAGALAAWQAAQAQLGFDRDNLTGVAHALRRLGRFEAAGSVLSAARLLFADDVEIAAHHALVAGECGDWSLAAERWSHLIEHVLGQTTLPPELSAEAARTFAVVGWSDRADELLARAIADAPDAVQLRVCVAVLAEMRGQFGPAVDAWDHALALRPGDDGLLGRRAQAAMKLAEETHEAVEPAASEVATPGQPVAGQPANDAAARGPVRPAVNSQTEADAQTIAILERMESLGGDCEFGLVQRHFGLEPASLMRFSYSERLHELLAADLAPLDDLDHIELELEGSEYMVRDRRGYFWTHSFIYKGEMSEEMLLKRQRARVSVLKRKMLAQLAAADRLFVFKERDEALDIPRLRELSAQLRRFGPNRLVGLRTADDDYPAGTVVDLDDWTQVAHIGQLYTTPRPVLDTASWLKVLPQLKLPEAQARQPLAATGS